MTDQERFNYVNKTGKQPCTRANKPTHGIIYYKGKPITGPMHFALLQVAFKQYLKHGFKKSDLKIRSHGN